MKIEQVLVHYLLKTKRLTLQGIGTFQLEGPIPESDDPEKPVLIPENSISFHYDPRATEDEELVNFITIHTRKIKPLASSDLDSFLSLGRQFLNIGKPFVLQNLGTLDKLNSGELVFQPGHIVAQKIEPQKIKIEEPENVEEEKLFNDYQKERKSNTGSKGILAILVILILGFAVWATWRYEFNKKNNDENLKTTESIVPITEDTSHPKKDSAIIANAAADSLKNAKRNAADTSGFKIVVRQFRSKEAALFRLKELKSYHRKVIMYTTDSVIYKIAEPFALPLSDTTKVLDSLKRYYTRVFVEVN